MCLPSVTQELIEQALVKASRRNATVAHNLPLRLWEQKHHNDEVESRKYDEEPKDRTPAQLLRQNTSNNGTETRCCPSAGVR